MQEEKTNVMRFLEQKKVVYRPHWYACPDGAVDGISVAALLGKDAETVFKTLVTQGALLITFLLSPPSGSWT